MTCFLNYFHFIPDPPLEFRLLLYVPLWYWPLERDNFVGIVLAGIDVNSLVHIALSSCT